MEREALERSRLLLEDVQGEEEDEVDGELSEPLVCVHG